MCGHPGSNSSYITLLLKLLALLMDLRNAVPLVLPDRPDKYGCYCWSCEQNIGSRVPRIIGTCSGCYDPIRYAIRRAVPSVKTEEHRTIFRQLINLLPCAVDKCNFPSGELPTLGKDLTYMQLEARIDGTTTMRFGIKNGEFFHAKFSDAEDREAKEAYYSTHGGWQAGRSASSNMQEERYAGNASSSNTQEIFTDSNTPSFNTDRTSKAGRVSSSNARLHINRRYPRSWRDITLQ